MEAVSGKSHARNNQQRDIVSQFGLRLRQLRHAHKWTQVDLSVHLGMSRSYLSDLEHGKREVCLRNIELIAVGFKIRPDELLRGL